MYFLIFKHIGNRLDVIQSEQGLKLLWTWTLKQWVPYVSPVVGRTYSGPFQSPLNCYKPLEAIPKMVEMGD